MKYAGAAVLESIEDLLAAVRVHKELIERKRGAFYLKSVGFLHFHEDPAGLFADVKTGPQFERLPANTPEEPETLLACIDAVLSAPRALASLKRGRS